METLRQVQNYLRQIPCINMGGCGISALTMYRWLKEHGQLTKNTKFIFLYTDDSQYDYFNNKRVMENGSGSPVAPSHVVLYHRGKYIDCRGERDIFEFDYTQNVQDEKFVVRTNNAIGTWNDYFERINIRDIQIDTEVDLSDILEKRLQKKWRFSTMFGKS